MENEWLKKKLDRLSVNEKKGLIELDNKGLSVRRQCELVGQTGRTGTMSQYRCEMKQ